MENENEFIHSQNDTTDVSTIEDINVLKEKYQELLEKHTKVGEANRQLFERTKKAEGELKVFKEKKPENKPEAQPKPADIDYAFEAYLIANNIKEADEVELLKQRMDGSGKTAKEILGNKYFHEELKELRDSKAVKNAIPSDSRRTNPSAKDTVDYWKSKIDSGSATLMDVPDMKLRREIVNSRINATKNVNHFTDNPFGDLSIPQGKPTI